ncbi:sigma 54-interacting transcriptional regulator [Aliiroseovarius subalbicans]|uniref:sigma 54-interacting transcriptional regulator n=1 Tax=Aliiroseovarius subalbicans TaxID=2925840 RepID=UPI001F55C78F|nr:sigma 54-interacting transcriptional regulator [Aliiroseovarius subalbicans]MCI2400931.1 sigma 54-interacting transcriptional regulator [Aliiroseovarius subalbicans]
MNIWPEHPIFSVETKEAANDSLDVLGDGIVSLGPDGLVVSANGVAARLLGVGGSLEGTDPADLSCDVDGWDNVERAVRDGRSNDFALRGSEGQTLMATTRHGPGGRKIRLIILRDIEAFEHRRDRVLNRASAERSDFFASERTRPDFSEQRRLCPAINRLLNRGERAVRQNAKILITGESGVGKTEIGRFLHNSVSDARDPFFLVNCASSSEAELNTLLFGAGGEGILDRSQGGTVFLDEVAELPRRVQVRLVGYLEDRKLQAGFEPTSGRRPPRIIAATNRALKELVDRGEFRSDLYFRLAVIELKVPPLRDLPPLVNHLIDRFSRTINQRRHAPMIVPQRIREILADYSFPGNIRELHNIIQRITVFIDDSDGLDELLDVLLSAVHVEGDSAFHTLSATSTLDLRSEVRRFERALIDKAIQIHGSKRKAAKALGVDIGTVVRKTAPPPQAPSHDISSDREKKNETNR